MPEKRAREGVLALDFGTSSVRAVVYDTAGRMIPTTLCDIRYKVDTTEPGQVSSQPDELVRLISRTIDESLAAARKRRLSIIAVGTSCYWHSLMGIDSKGRPTTELITWADTRSSQQTRWLRSHADEHAYHARTGCFFHASYWPAKLRWIKETNPIAFRRTARWVSLGEYLYIRLFGDCPVSISLAAGTGLLDIMRCQWDKRSLRLAGIDEDRVGRLSDWDQACSGLRPPYARRWPELKGVPWYLAVGDGGLANIGAGAVKAGFACATIGTSSALRIITSAKRLKIPWGTFVYRIDRERFVIGGALSEGGNAIGWLTADLGREDKQELERLADAIEPDGHGLTVLPFWAGERSPNWRADARGAIVGLSLGTEPAELVRATMEAITYQLAAVAESIQKVTRAPQAVIATGGELVHSAGWAQMLADALNLTVLTSREKEASSRGAALLALHAEGRLPDLWEMTPSTGARHRPRKRVHAIYAKARERQQRLYDLLLPPAGQPEHGTPIAAAGSGSRKKDLRTPAARH
jgi:gluconokinase